MQTDYLMNTTHFDDGGVFLIYLGEYLVVLLLLFSLQYKFNTTSLIYGFLKSWVKIQLKWIQNDF